MRIDQGEVWRVGDHVFACVDVETLGAPIVLRSYGPPALSFTDLPYDKSVLDAYIDHLVTSAMLTQGDVFFKVRRQSMGRLNNTIIQTGGDVLDVWSATKGEAKEAVVRAFWSGDVQLDDYPEPGELDASAWPKWVIENFTVPGEIVADLNTGPGLVAVTTAVLDRKFLGIDASPEKITRAAERVARTSDATPEHIETLEGVIA